MIWVFTEEDYKLSLNSMLDLKSQVMYIPWKIRRNDFPGTARQGKCAKHPVGPSLFKERDAIR